MGKRREGRETAIQFLYQIDLNAQEEGDAPSTVKLFWELLEDPEKKGPTPKTKVFTEQLVAGVTAHRAEIDEQIKKYAANYELSRIAAVDRNILRVAIYEMLYCTDIAPVIAINEAIEIAKKYGSDKSGGFVNGILDRIKKELNRPAREPLTPPGNL